MSGPWDIDDEPPAAAPVTMPAGYDAYKLATPPEFETMGPPPWLPPDAGPATSPPRRPQVAPKTSWTLKDFEHPPKEGS